MLLNFDPTNQFTIDFENESRVRHYILYVPRIKDPPYMCAYSRLYYFIYSL